MRRPRCTRASGVYHNPHVNANGMDAMARNPPAQNTPSIIYGTLDTLLARRCAGRVLESSEQCLRHRARRQDADSYNYSAGVQREIGWGTVLDVTYAGFQMRHGEMATNINPVPDGARFVDVNPQNADPQNPTTAKPNEFLRPYLGYQDITIRSHFGTAYVQLAAGAAQSALHQRPAVRGRLHARQDRQRWQPDPSTRCGRGRPGTRRPTARRSSTTWSSTTPGTCRTAARCGTTSLTRGLLDGWQLSGDTAFVSGDWAGASDLDDRQLRLHRRRRRQRGRGISGDVLCTSGNCDPTPGGRRQLPQRLGLQPADRPRRHRQRAARPSSGCRRSSSRTCPSSRTSSSAAAVAMQFRWEAYNVFNQVNWSTHQHDRAVQPRGRAGQRELRPGDGGPASPRDAGRDTIHLLSRG